MESGESWDGRYLSEESERYLAESYPRGGLGGDSYGAPVPMLPCDPVPEPRPTLPRGRVAEDNYQAWVRELKPGDRVLDRWGHEHVIESIADMTSANVNLGCLGLAWLFSPALAEKLVARAHAKGQVAVVERVITFTNGIELSARDCRPAR